MTPKRQAMDPGEHEENQTKEQNTDSKSRNESEDPSDDKPVEKAELVNKWCWDKSLDSEREMMNDSIPPSLLSSTKENSCSVTSVVEG